MGWRVVSISSRVKLELKMNFLVIRGEVENEIFINEISVLVIENTAVSLTCSLIENLISNKILVIFCDRRRLPMALIRSLHGSCDTSLKIVAQSKWTDAIKDLVWTELVKTKIRNQALLLKNYDSEGYEQLTQYFDQVEIGDVTNREGFAAKVYFNRLFGSAYSRRDECFINHALDYGYAILLATVSREIYANGYITEIGLFHSNQFNQTNLASDLMEIFRPIIDRKVLEFPLDAYELTSDFKHELINILNLEVLCAGRNTTLLNAIQYFVKSVFDAIEHENIALLQYYEF